ncbi:MAG: hypothetical protein ACI8PZ_005164 [Myxococcota bacterium]|jgi:hypothetical protein
MLVLLLLACLPEATHIDPPAPGEVAPVTAPAPAPADPVAAMRAQPLDYTRHARCRMGCRKFDEGEVKAILATGTFDPSRSRHDGDCPSHALEGTTSDGQHARMVFAACPDETRVVTVIDLDTDWPCDCD